MAIPTTTKRNRNPATFKGWKSLTYYLRSPHAAALARRRTRMSPAVFAPLFLNGVSSTLSLCDQTRSFDFNVKVADATHAPPRAAPTEPPSDCPSVAKSSTASASLGLDARTRQVLWARSACRAPSAAAPRFWQVAREIGYGRAGFYARWRGYRHHGVQSLTRKRRSDLGHSRALTRSS